MSEILVEPSVVAEWNIAFASGSDKSYPSLEVVRLERWFYKGKPGRLLEYGHGSGVNLIHLLRCGHEIEAIDVSTEARKLVEKKIQALPELAPRLSLTTLNVGSTTLPYPDATFDYVNCISVLSLLGSRERAVALIAEFKRVLKPGGKAIIDVNSANSDFARGARREDGDIFFYRGRGGAGDPVPTWCPEKLDSFTSLFNAWQLEDVGYAAHKYCGSEIHEFIACVSKPE